MNYETNWEAAYLHSVLIDPRVLRTHPVSPEWFGQHKHRKAFELLRDLDEGDGVCAVALSNAHPGGASYVYRLGDGTAAPADLAAEGVRDGYVRRVVGEIGRGLIDSARDHATPIDVAIGDALANLKGHVGGEDVDTLTDVLKATMARVEEVHHAQGRIGIETGFTLLDRIICGWEPGKLYFIAARPKAGKTAFALATTTCALSQGARVYVASREMGKEQLGLRMLSSEARVNSQDMRRAHLNEQSFGKLSSALGRMSRYGGMCFVDTDSKASWERLRSKILREHSRSDLGLVVIDYIQLLRSGSRRDNRAEELEVIAYDLKDLAKEIKAPVVALSQLNREQDEAKPPSIDKMKGSGGLEQAADAVVLLWRPDIKNVGTVEVIVGANRDGPTGKFRTEFQPEYAAFT